MSKIRLFDAREKDDEKGLVVRYFKEFLNRPLHPDILYPEMTRLSVKMDQNQK